MEVAPKQEEAAFEPALSRSAGRRMLAYAHGVYDLGELMAEKIKDSRQKPDIPLPVISSTIFLAGLLRVESFNALESLLEEDWFAHAVGAFGGGLTEIQFAAVGRSTLS